MDAVVCLFRLWAAMLPPFLPIRKLKILIKVSFVEKKSNIFLNCLLGERNKYSPFNFGKLNPDMAIPTIWFKAITTYYWY